jgi:hypothetical protein
VPDVERHRIQREPDLFVQLTPQRLLARLARLDPAPGRPPDGHVREVPAAEQDVLVVVDDQRAHAGAQVRFRHRGT